MITKDDELWYAEIYVYCTKTNYFGYISNRYIGKVLFKFRCYKVEEIGMWNYSEYGTPTLMEDCLCLYSCLNFLELKNYIKGKPSIAIHISDLEVFDKPRELSKFRHYTNVVIKSKSPYTGEPHYSNNKILRPLTKAPQSYMFIDID